MCVYVCVLWGLLSKILVEQRFNVSFFKKQTLQQSKGLKGKRQGVENKEYSQKCQTKLKLDVIILKIENVLSIEYAQSKNVYFLFAEGLLFCDQFVPTVSVV